MKNCQKWKRHDPAWFGMYGYEWGNRCKLSRYHPDNFNKISKSQNNRGSPNYPIEIGCQKTCRNACSERRITKGIHKFYQIFLNIYDNLKAKRRIIVFI